MGKRAGYPTFLKSLGKRKRRQQPASGTDIIDRVQCSLAGSSLKPSRSFRKGIRCGFFSSCSCCFLLPLRWVSRRSGGDKGVRQADTSV